MTDQAMKKQASNQNLTPEKVERLRKIYKELDEIGLAGVYGAADLARTQDEQDFFLTLENFYIKKAQDRLIHQPFKI